MFRGGFRVFRDTNYKCHNNTYLLFCLHAEGKMYHLLFFMYVLSLAYLRGRMYRILRKWESKYLKSAIFLSVISWMRRKKCREVGGSGVGYKKHFVGRGWSLIGGLEKFQNKRFGKKGWEKNWKEGFDHQRNYVVKLGSHQILPSKTDEPTNQVR